MVTVTRPRRTVAKVKLQVEDIYTDDDSELSDFDFRDRSTESRDDGPSISSCTESDLDSSAVCNTCSDSELETAFSLFEKGTTASEFDFTQTGRGNNSGATWEESCSLSDSGFYDTCDTAKDGKRLFPDKCVAEADSTTDCCPLEKSIQSESAVQSCTFLPNKRNDHVSGQHHPKNNIDIQTLECHQLNDHLDQPGVARERLPIENEKAIPDDSDKINNENKLLRRKAINSAQITSSSINNVRDLCEDGHEHSRCDEVIPASVEDGPRRKKHKTSERNQTCEKYSWPMIGQFCMEKGKTLHLVLIALQVVKNKIS